MDKKINVSEINVWRIHAKTDAGNIFDYFRKNNVAAFGWSLCKIKEAYKEIEKMLEDKYDINLSDNDKNDDNARHNVYKKYSDKLEGIYDKLTEAHNKIANCSLEDIRDADGTRKRTLDAYYNIYENLKYYEKEQKNTQRVLQHIKPNDLIWTRHNGKYYIGLVTKESQYIFNASYDAVYNDACNQITGIKWLPENGLDESEVAGAIATAFIKGSTFQKINKTGVKEFSGLLYNSLVNKKYKEGYYKIKIDEADKQDTFYSWLSPSDCEDLLCFWLYTQKKYICIPSTNKKSTQTYECVLLDSTFPTKHIYIQVKKGEESLYIENYKELSKNGEVWLLTTAGKVYDKNGNVVEPNEDKEYGPNTIYVIDPKTLYGFAMGKNTFIPPAIRTFANGISDHIA